MAFQIKDFVSITLGMINHAKGVTEKITDYQPGSVARTLMEGPAVEIEELYLQMFLGLREAIPVATFLSFGFDLRPAATAHGFVTISKVVPPTADIPIPAGTSFTAVDGRAYTSSVAVTWLAGSESIRVPVEASSPGLSGNISSGLITSSPAFGSDFIISNSALTNGMDEESDTEREARFAEFVASLSRGTVVACLYAAKQSRVLDADGNIYEYVTRAGIDEEPGHVRIYLYSSRGVPSSDLLANGQLRIDGTRDDEAGTITPGFRSAGVRVDILPMQERSISMAVQVEMFAGYALTQTVEQNLFDTFATAVSSVPPGGTLYIGTLVELLLSVPGVRAVVPSATENILCDVNEALIPGALTVSPL